MRVRKSGSFLKKKIPRNKRIRVTVILKDRINAAIAVYLTIPGATCWIRTSSHPQ